MKKILCIIGTRPEAIKMAPVVKALRNEPWAAVTVVATAQHRDMLDQTLAVFGIKPDYDLDIMRPNQRLSDLTWRLGAALDDIVRNEAPDIVLAQGDTTSVMVAALCAFYNRIPFGHVEAGLRTGDLGNPYPEEMNRVVAGRMAHWHFAPTAQAKANLLAEGIPEHIVHVTGNTVIDALLHTAQNAVSPPIEIPRTARLILLTAHRRESFGAPLNAVFQAVRQLIDQYQDVYVLYPVHPNPNVQKAAHAVLGGHPRINLCHPLDYAPFVSAMKRAYLVLTDSGGVQEEAPALGKPVLVLRNETERPEAVAAGVVKLVGTDPKAILNQCQVLLDEPDAYKQMARGVSPYGDGKAAERIVRVLASTL